MSPEEIHYQRESNKIGLETFTLNLQDNNYGNSVKELVNSMQTELDEKVFEYIVFQESKGNDMSHMYYLDTEYLEDRLMALSEMNVVYTFRNFEVHLKKLITAAYSVSPKEFHRWDKITSFLRSKSIKFDEFEGYIEVIQLQKINNSIKHSFNLVNDKTQKIPEFTDTPFGSLHDKLNEFIERIKDKPYKFLEKLSNEIYKDLYEFDSARIDHIAELFALRMDKNTANEFARCLKSKY